MAVSPANPQNNGFGYKRDLLMNFSLYPFPAKIGARIVFDYEGIMEKEVKVY